MTVINIRVLLAVIFYICALL